MSTQPHIGIDFGTSNSAVSWLNPKSRMPATFTPYPKNPVIARFFRQIGRADELGSGMRKMMKYGRAYGGTDPELIEGDVFKMFIKVPDDSSAQATGEVAAEVTAEVTAEVIAQVTEFCREPRSAKEIMGLLELKHWKTFQANYLSPLMKSGVIEMTIPDKPRSSKQKYRLTAAGRETLEKSGAQPPGSTG